MNTTQNTIRAIRSIGRPKTIDTSDSFTTQQTKRHFIQNFLLIWLDTNIDESNDDFHNSITHLRHIVNTIKIFTHADQCVDFLTEITDEKVFMIVSGVLGQRILPLIHDVSQLHSVFIFCENKLEHEQWAKDWSKVKGVSTEIEPICESIIQAARQCDQDSISISFISADDASNQNLDQLDQTFMYTQILKEILFEIEHNERSVKDFATYSRRKCTDKGLFFDLNSIAKFEQEYRLQSPIWWYTHECFLYSTLNRALRNQEVDTLIKIGFFIQDLHQHIQQLHLEQSTDQLARITTVYRGQGLSKTDFEKLMKTKGGLMSFNNFLSTSIDRAVSFAFAESNHNNPDLIGILFEISIDPSISTAPFALLDNVGHYQDSEQEILFSMHTVFRIGEARQLGDSNRLWQVQLTLTSDNDPLLSALTERLREETQGGSVGRDRLGKLLIRLGESDEAEQVYQALLDQPSNDNEKAHYYHHLGVIKRDQGDYLMAVAFFEKALELHQKSFSPNHSDMTAYYINIGVVYDDMGEYTKALLSYEKALEIYHKALAKDSPNLATLYNNIGLVYFNMNEYSKALSNYEKALQIEQKDLPPNHPSLATSYSNIGAAYNELGKHSEALLFYKKSLKIGQKVLPPDHPELARDYNNIGSTYYLLGEYSKALSFEEKALEIRQRILSSNHPALATSYNNIGETYSKMGEYSKALSSLEKALEIRQRVLPPDHPLLATTYANIGLLYLEMNKYLKALSFLEKSLEIRQRILSPNNPDLPSSYNNIGLLYFRMNEYSKALLFYEKALEIREGVLSLGHPDLATSYNNIGVLYSKMGEHPKALSFLEKALEIQERVLLPNHPSLTTSYENIGLLYLEIGQFSKGLSFLQRTRS